jgi:hypothetical protein
METINPHALKPSNICPAPTPTCRCFPTAYSSRHTFFFSLHITLFPKIDFSCILALAASQAPKPSLIESLASYNRRDGRGLLKLWKQYANINHSRRRQLIYADSLQLFPPYKTWNLSVVSLLLIKQNRS